jgi:cytochrome c-type biogenesis protein CcmH/NrfG
LIVPWSLFPLSRPVRTISPVPARRARPSWSRRLRRMNKPQLAFALLGLLAVCSLVAVSLSTIAADVLLGDDTSDAENFASGENDDLANDLRAQIQDNPEDADLMAQLAVLLAYDGKLDESIQWYERALAIDPNDVDTRFSFAQSLIQGGKQADAELQLLKVLELNPNHYEAHFYLAELYRLWDPPRTEEAAAHYYRVIEIAPDAYLAGQSKEALTLMGYVTPAVSGTPTAGTPMTEGT